MDSTQESVLRVIGYYVMLQSGVVGLMSSLHVYVTLQWTGR